MAPARSPSNLIVVGAALDTMQQIEAHLYYINGLALVTLEANGVRQLLAQITVLRNFAAPGNDYALFAELLLAG